MVLLVGFGKEPDLQVEIVRATINFLRCALKAEAAKKW